MWPLLCICFGMLMGLAGAAIWSWRHLPEGLSREEISQKLFLASGEKKVFWIEFWYPLAYKIYVFFKKRGWLLIHEEQTNQLQKLYIGQGEERLREFYFCQRVLVILWLITGVSLCIIIGILSEHKETIFDGGYQLVREEPGGGSRQIKLEMDTQSDRKEVTIVIPERQYTMEEIQAKMEEAKKHILDNYLGENPSSEQVSQPLQLVSQIPDSRIRVEWELDNSGYINQDGTLNQDEIKEAVEVELMAILSYGEEKEKLFFEVTLLPREMSQQELFWEGWNQELNSRKEESPQETMLSLPEEVHGTKISYREKESLKWLGILALGLLGCVLTSTFLDYRTEQRIIKREEALRKEYPELVERFILLIGAGLSIRGAWYRITEDYQKRCQSGERAKHYLYEEMLVTRRTMENGQSEVQAYSDFGRRLSLIQYMRFHTLLIQNLRKGSEDLLQRMDLEAKDALQERRELARKSGEEAGTKLLVPMMLMLVIVFAMILIAAFQNL